MIRVMVVDDHEIVREGIKTILQGEPDFEVVAEAGSAEGLGDLVEKTWPDVVLLDARLPGLSGPEACRHLVTAHPDIAVLIVSTYSDDHLVEECIKAGAKGYVVKDIERFSLKESIRAVHRGEGAVSPAIARRSSTGCATKKHLPHPGPTIPLSETQLEILRLIAAGFSNREIASRVSSVRTPSNRTSKRYSASSMSATGWGRH